MTDPVFVYELADASGAVLYVGCTDNLGRRLLNHKTREWWPDVNSINATRYETRVEGLFWESVGIAHHQPRHNVAGTDRQVASVVRGHKTRRSRREAAHAAGNLCNGVQCVPCRERGHELGIHHYAGCKECAA